MSIAILVGFVLPIAIVAMSLRHKRWKMEFEARNHQLNPLYGRPMNASPIETDNSLSVSELQTMIRTAVEDATKPLKNRIAELEQANRTMSAMISVPDVPVEPSEGKSVGRVSSTV